VGWVRPAVKREDESGYVPPQTHLGVVPGLVPGTHVFFSAAADAPTSLHTTKVEY